MRRGGPAALSAVIALLLGAGAAAAEADGRRAAHLAGACSACHLGGDATMAIPGLAGRSPDDFLAAMRAFRGGERKSQVMAAVAKALSDQELALLAEYFADETPAGAGQ